MPFEKITPEKLSYGVVRQIELLIMRGVLRPGEKLPPERELSERLGVSRPSLREALSELSDAGLLNSRAGAGVYVSASLESSFPPPLIRLFATHDEAVFDYLSFRRDLEGMAAERAARMASETDLKVIDTAWKKIRAMHDRRNPAEEARLDAEYHLAIVEASHNVVMLHIMRSMYGLLKEGVFYNRQQLFRQKNMRQMILNQHEAINAALQARDAEGARQAVEDHITFVEISLKDQRKASAHENIARQRYAHDIARD